MVELSIVEQAHLTKALKQIEEVMEQRKRSSVERRQVVFSSMHIILGDNIAEFHQEAIVKDTSRKDDPVTDADKYYSMTLSIMSRSDSFGSVSEAVKGVHTTSRPKPTIKRLSANDAYKNSKSPFSKSKSLNILTSTKSYKSVDNSSIRPSMTRNESWGQSEGYWEDAASSIECVPNLSKGLDTRLGKRTSRRKPISSSAPAKSLSLDCLASAKRRVKSNTLQEDGSHRNASWGSPIEAMEEKGKTSSLTVVMLNQKGVKGKGIHSQYPGNKNIVAIPSSSQANEPERNTSTATTA